MSTPRGAWWSQEQTQAALQGRQAQADAATAGLDPMSNALQVRTAVPAELDGLDADAIKRMSMSSYAEIRRRAGLADCDPFEDAYRGYEPSQAPQAPTTVSAPEAIRANAEMPQGLDVSQLSMEQYAALRGRLGMGQHEDRGIFGGVASQSQEYANAVRGQTGRTGLSNAHVQQAPRIEGRYLNPDEHRDTRTLSARFTTPGNAFGA